MIFEPRHYRLKPGRRERRVKWMEENIIPYQVPRLLATPKSAIQ